MDPGGFAFEIEVWRGGALVRRTPASLAACFEDALFREIVSGRHANDGSVPPFRARPVFDAGPPVVRAVELWLADEIAATYAREVFGAQASGCIADLVRERALDLAGEPSLENLEWRVVAEPAPPVVTKLRAQLRRTPLPIETADVPAAAAGRVSAEIDAGMLDDVARAYASAGRVERAWLLMGAVRIEPARAATAVAIHAAVPVETHADGASDSHFHFEPRALLRARDLARREHPGRTCVGWLHTHPACAACPAKPECDVDMRFFSSADVEVHTSAFPSPFMVGVVVAKAGDRSVASPGARAYGWQGARVREIDLRIGNLNPTR